MIHEKGNTSINTQRGCTCSFLEYKQSLLRRILRKPPLPVCKLLYENLYKDLDLETILFLTGPYVKYITCPYGSEACFEKCKDEGTVERLTKEYKQVLSRRELPLVRPPW